MIRTATKSDLAAAPQASRGVPPHAVRGRQGRESRVRGPRVSRRGSLVSGRVSLVNRRVSRRVSLVSVRGSLVSGRGSLVSGRVGRRGSLVSVRLSRRGSPVSGPALGRVDQTIAVGPRLDVRHRESADRQGPGTAVAGASLHRQHRAVTMPWRIARVSLISLTRSQLSYSTHRFRMNFAPCRRVSRRLSDDCSQRLTPPWWMGTSHWLGSSSRRPSGEPAGWASCGRRRG